MEEWNKIKEISKATRYGFLAHNYTKKGEDFTGEGFKFQEGAESYEQRFWLEASTKIINISNHCSSLTTHSLVGYWLPASSRGMVLIRRQMLPHFPTVTQSAGFQPEPLLTRV